jgi:RNA polymerase sigma-70 factor, ECF subfamily
LDDLVVVGDGASPDLDTATAQFVAVRGRLFGITYRMLGSRSEAEDIVQEVWVRWQNYDRSTVVDPAAFLATTTTRLCINALQSARARRETYIGPWLPEPVDTSADPLLGAERGEAMELATR